MARNNWAFVLASLLSLSCAFAVDRKKFRTCEQTSFCRRHRSGNSARLYNYKLVKESIELHVPTSGSGDDTAETKDAASKDGTKAIWKSVMSRIMKSSDGRELDPYVRGPPAALSGKLIYTAQESSSGTSVEELLITVHAHQDGVARIRITELYGTADQPYGKARVTYDELVLNLDEMHATTDHLELLLPETHGKLLDPFVKSVNGSKGNFVALQYGSEANRMTMLMQVQPFAAHLFRSDHPSSPVVSMCTDKMMHFEIRRPKPASAETREDKAEDDGEESENSDHIESENSDHIESEEKEIVGYWEDGLAIYADGTREQRPDKQEEDHRQLTEHHEGELDFDGMWEESFESHKDSKPHGPMSVGMDVSFPRSSHLFGLPEHASSTALKATLGTNAHYSEPYRLYNLDVFEYELDETMALYGSVPLVVSHSAETGTVGVLWLNPTETFVDVIAPNDASAGTKTHWMSESGILDMFLLPGPTPPAFYEQYAHLTGRMPLPPMFSLGYHQCRWNYKDEQDVYQVHAKFEELDYPYDVLWLDIEHTDGKRYFTWDHNLFPHPKDMQEKLASQGRRMVTIVDPHIKRDNKYHVHKEATSKGLYVKDSSGSKDYDGWCWPGSSSYLDFTSEKVRSWWAQQFAYKKYEGSTPTLFTWNDMNEPSVFNGPEVTMQKDLLNLNNEEHREWHNLYGMLFHRATGEGHIIRDLPGKNTRPFVLSRSFFAGSQRYGAIWTGDNESSWAHLAIAAPMLLSLNAAALSFVGADVGGFFGNPDAELMTRWMQAGAYQPFFRGHAHHDSKRREPWMFGDETMIRLRKAAMARYALLPYWYSVFREAGVTGMPVMRTMWMQYPQIESLFSTDHQYLLGSDLLVRPVVEKGAVETVVSFPGSDLWYDVDTMMRMPVKGNANDAIDITVSADLDKIPVYQRGGSILPRKLRLRRSARLMKTDPYTLYVALDSDQKASGKLYMDDEETSEHEKGEYAVAYFSADFGGPNLVLENNVEKGAGWTASHEEPIERIVIMGLEKAPNSLAVDGQPLHFSYDAASKVLVIRKPLLSAVMEWAVTG